MNRFVPFCLALALVGCSMERPPAPTIPADAPLRDGFGRASIQIRWPERRAVQAIPYDAMVARLTAYDASGSVIATASIVRAEGVTLAQASLDLPVGSGNTLAATLDSRTEAEIAVGRSEAFSVQRNQTVQVPVTLAPTIRTRFGPINAYSVSGGTTPSAGLGRIWTVAVGPDDTMYLVDFSNHAVRAVAPDGVSRVVAGQVTDTATQSKGVASTLSPDNSGDGGPAVAATLRTPHGVYVAPDGDLFIADTLSLSPAQIRLRYVPATSRERFGADRQAGYIYTLYTMATAFGAIGMVLDQDGSILFSQQNRNEIWRLTTAGTASVLIGGGSTTADGTPPSGASLAAPWGLVRDGAGNLLFSEYQGSRVRMLCRTPGRYYGIPMEADRVYTVMDGVAAKAQFALANAPFPRQIALDRQANLLVVDSSSHGVYRVDRASGTVTRVAGGVKTSTTIPLGDGEPAASASFNAPQGLAIDSRDRLYIGDSLNGRVRWLHL